MYKQEKKSNLNGLNGSLVFRMLENSRPFPVKPLKDQKLMIYDILKAKYREQKKEESKEVLSMDRDDFMKLSPLQIFGLVELKGGLKQL